MAKAARKTAKVTVELGSPSPKKNVVRFDSDSEDAALANVYVTKAAMEQLGNPDALRITIEAA